MKDNSKGEGAGFMRAYFKKDIEKACKYCEHGVSVSEGTAVLCEKIGGVMQPHSKCRKFKYDPLKREPHVITLNSDFKKEDFSL